MVHASCINIFLAVFLVDVQAMIAPAFFAEGFDETAVGVINDHAVRPIGRHIDLTTLINHDAAMSGADVIMSGYIAPVRHDCVGPFGLTCGGGGDGARDTRGEPRPPHPQLPEVEDGKPFF